MHDLSEDTTSLKNIEFGISSPQKSYKFLNEKPKGEENINDLLNLKTYESPEESLSESKGSSLKKITIEPIESLQSSSLLEAPFEDDNIETVKLDSSRLRSQKRGLPMDEKSPSKEETPKGTSTQRRIINTQENCYTGEKYILGDCFTDEKIYEMRLRKAVTSSKKINPLQILKDVKSPGSSYISSAKKALMEDYNENDRIHFEISANKNNPIQVLIEKENIRDNHKIKVEGREEAKDLVLMNFNNPNKFQLLEQDYNELESPEKSHHKHSKSRSRTKEKRGNFSEEELDNIDILPTDSFEEAGDNTCMAIDFNTSPEPTKKPEEKDLDDTSKSIEWIIANSIDKRKRDEICKIIGEEESRNTLNENFPADTQEDNSQEEIEVEEVKRVKFGNQLINSSTLGNNFKEDTDDSNLGQYIEWTESVASSPNKSVKADVEKEFFTK